MIFDLILVFVLLFMINAMAYQFLYAVYPWIGITTLVFYVLYLTFKILFYIRRRKRMQYAAESVVSKPKSTGLMAKKEEAPVEQKPIDVKKVEPKPVEVKTTPVIDKDTQTLKAFIEKNKAEGFTEKIIRAALLKQGWPRQKVDDAFGLVK